MWAWINNPGLLQFQIFEGYMQGLGRFGRIARLEFHAEPEAAAEDEQIQLGAGVSAPKVHLLVPCNREDLYG